jgi:hypothetical protein
MLGSRGIKKAAWKEIGKGRTERRINIKKNRQDRHD